MTSSWTENTNIVWRNLGIKYVRDKNNNIPENSGQIVQKYLFRREDEFRHWERSFLANNSMCPPTVNDIKNDPYAADIFSRVKVGKSLLDIWNIAF